MSEMPPRPVEQTPSLMRGDPIWDKVFKVAGVNMDAFNEYCLDHPAFMRKLGDANSYARPVIGAVALGTFAHAINSENRKLAAVSLGLFTVACLTDSWDGYWPRKGNVASPKGAKLDQIMDVVLRLETLALLAAKGNKTDRALLVPRAYYELQLLRIRNDDEQEGGFKSSLLGKAKVIADSVTGGALIAELLPKDPAVRKAFAALRVGTEIGAIGLVRTDVRKRKTQKA